VVGAGYELRVASYGLRVTGCGLRVASYGLRVASYGLRVSGIRKLECGMRKIRKGVCMRSNLILFVLMLVNQNFIGDDEKVTVALLLKELRRLI
jgi:hypothetical protein